jgi:hypothetical protein
MKNKQRNVYTNGGESAPKREPGRRVDPWGFFSWPHCTVNVLRFQCEELVSYVGRGKGRVRDIENAMTCRVMLLS